MEQLETTGGESGNLLSENAQPYGNSNYLATTPSPQRTDSSAFHSAKLLRRLRRVIRASLFFLNVLYGVAIVLLLLGFGIFSVIEWFIERFGNRLAIGEGVCIGGAFVWLQMQYSKTRGFLKRAQRTLTNPRLDDDLFKIISDALKYYSDRLWNGLAIVVTAWSAPLTVKAPEYISTRTYDGGKSAPTDSYVDGVRVVVGICAAVLGYVATKALEKARKKSLETIDDVVDHVDDMPEFDWVDKYTGDDSDSDDEGSHHGLVA